MNRKRTNSDFLNGVPELLILSLLSRRPMYGYELVQAIRLATGEKLEFGEGCVYPILHRLEAEGALEGKRQQAAGRSRVVYRVTKKGTARLAGSEARWRQIAQTIGMVLQGGEHGGISLA